MSLDREQQRIVRLIRREGRNIRDPHARKVYERAAVQTGLVESSLHNLKYGDSSSVGWRQELDTYGSVAERRDLKASIRRFRQEFQQFYDPGEKSYDVAAQVQRPAEQFRGRYHDRAGEAAQILRQSDGGPSAGPNASQGVPPKYRTVPGVDNSQARMQLAQQYFLNSHDPGALIAYKQGVDQAQDVPSSRELVAPGMQAQQTTGGKPRFKKGTANFEGHKVAAWIAPALRYARKQGWKGQVNSGFRSYEDQKRIYDSGVRPAAKPGTSNHEGSQYPRGAVDVSDAQQLAEILLQSKWRHKLIYAGSKDPVHFSHPHNGAY